MIGPIRCIDWLDSTHWRAWFDVCCGTFRCRATPSRRPECNRWKIQDAGFRSSHAHMRVHYNSHRIAIGIFKGMPSSCWQEGTSRHCM